MGLFLSNSASLELENNMFKLYGNLWRLVILKSPAFKHTNSLEASLYYLKHLNFDLFQSK